MRKAVFPNHKNSTTINNPEGENTYRNTCRCSLGGVGVLTPRLRVFFIVGIQNTTRMLIQHLMYCESDGTLVTTFF